MVTSITGSETLPTGLDPNFERALEKVQDDVDFYAMLSAMGKQVTDANGNALYWSDNRIHNLSADNFLGIKFAEGYEPAAQNLVFSGTLTSDQVAAVNAGKPIEIASSGGDSVLKLDTKTGAVSTAAANATTLAASSANHNQLPTPPITTPRTYLGDRVHFGTMEAAIRMKA
jgi:hypothetical protein